MVYVTVKQPPRYHQMSLEEFLFSDVESSVIVNPNLTNTRTYTVEEPSERLMSRISVRKMIGSLIRFNDSAKELREVPRYKLYKTYYIPKSSGGLRRIDEPRPELKCALYKLKAVFETDFAFVGGAQYHTSAFAYIKKRGTLDAIKRHQQNESKWKAKYDLSNFFGSTTQEFVMEMLSMIFPFSEVIRQEVGKREMEMALDLAFLNGGLPQGSPLSPLITNIMMIPIDHRLSNDFREFRGAGRKEENRNMPQKFICTRYADDFIISSRYDFSYKAIEAHIMQVLRGFHAPFEINSEKTKYGSFLGSNWNLGLMLNGNNEITVGYKNKRRFQAMLSSYIMDRKKGVRWDLHDIQTMEGYRNYYRMVEKDTIDRIVKHIDDKFGVDVVSMIREDISNRPGNPGKVSEFTEYDPEEYDDSDIPF